MKPRLYPPLLLGDCIELMSDIPDDSLRTGLADLPHSIALNASHFNTHRILQEYIVKAYFECRQRMKRVLTLGVNSNLYEPRGGGR